MASQVEWPSLLELVQRNEGKTTNARLVVYIIAEGRTNVRQEGRLAQPAVSPIIMPENVEAKGTRL